MSNPDGGALPATNHRSVTSCTCTFSLPASLLEAIDEAAERGGMSRSVAIRDLLTPELRARGVWPRGR